jgi:Domain of unknown function (DUF4249)
MPFSKKYIFIFLASFLCLSCLDPIALPLRFEASKLVVEGLLTNDKSQRFLRLSLTSQAGTSTQITPTNGAYAEVRTKTQKTIFRPSPNANGIYLPENDNFVAKTGENYQLYVKLPDGREYLSTAQTMPAAVEIQTISEKFLNAIPYGYNVSVDWKDPSETKNFYRWTASGYYQRLTQGVPVGFSICCNQCWVLQENSEVNVFSDAFTNGSTIRGRQVLYLPFYLARQNLAKVNQFNITEEAYQFWQNYKAQQQRTGSIFDPIPAALYGNVNNIADGADIALGFFEVSAVTTKKYDFIDRPDANIITAFLTNSAYIPAGDCAKVYPNATYIFETPSGW